MADTSRPRRTAEESRESLVHAAILLFRERPPNRVSVREIASAAGVNHGLVHRLFGGKDGLVNAVLRQVFRETGSAITAGLQTDLAGALTRGLDVLARERWVVDVVAHVMLRRRSADGIPSATMMPVLRERLGDRAGQDLALAVATAEAATLGWLLFEPLVARGTGLDSLSPKERRAGVARVLARMLQSELGPWELDDDEASL
jgi:AcrR family transcriptional regulator